jgi:hypothetical protein
MKTSSLNMLASVACGLTVLLSLSGCTGYTVGSTLPPGIASIYIPTFTNLSGEPQLESETTNAAISEFQKDGSLRIVSETQADAVLEVTITDYKIVPLRFEQDNPTNSKEYRMFLTVKLVLTRTKDGEVVVKREGVEGNKTFTRTGSLSAAKQAILPEAARDLAHKIVVSVAEYW